MTNKDLGVIPQFLLSILSFPLAWTEEWSGELLGWRMPNAKSGKPRYHRAVGRAGGFISLLQSSLLVTGLAERKRKEENEILNNFVSKLQNQSCLV